MKITKQLENRKIRKIDWGSDEWVKALYVGSSFIIGLNELSREVVLPYDPKDEEWVLLNPHIPLKDLKVKPVEEIE